MQLRLSTQAFWIDQSSRAILGHFGLRGKSVFYDFVAGASSSLVLDAGEKASFSFLCECRVGSYLDPDPSFAGVPDELRDVAAMPQVIEQLIAAARANFLRRVGFNKPPEVQPALQNRLWRARLALLRTGYQGDGRGEFGSRVASTCVANCSGFTRVFFWDSLFTSAAWRLSNRPLPAMRRSACSAAKPRRATARNTASTDGCLRVTLSARPRHRWLRGRWKNTSSSTLRTTPFSRKCGLTWCAITAIGRSMATRTGTASRSGPGKAQTADNSPLYDEQGTTIGWMPPVASVQLAAFAYRDAMSLSRFADRLGKKDDAQRYRARAERLFRDFTRVCYVPEDKCLLGLQPCHTPAHEGQDVLHVLAHLGGNAGAARGETPLDRRRAAGPEAVFRRPFRFPSAAYDEPSYDPMGYWRGKTWPERLLLDPGDVDREGYAAQAEEAAKRFLAAWFRDKSYSENMGTDPGVYAGGGSADYNWGVAAVYLIGAGAYRNPLP